MKYTKDEIEASIKKLVAEGKNEDAILVIMYELGGGSNQDYVDEKTMLARLNQFLRTPFTREDLQISLNVLKQRNHIEAE